MGNQSSKDSLIESINQRRIRPLHKSNNIFDEQQSFERRSRMLSKKKSAIAVTPVRHQLVLNDHVSPLVSLSSASSFGSRNPKRRMSSNSVTSEEVEPNTPTSNNHSRSSYDEANHSSMNEHNLTKRLSSSLPVKYSDNIVIETTNPTAKINRQTPFAEKAWVCEYGAEKERDRQTRQHYVLKQVFQGNIHLELNEPSRILDSACGVGLWTLEMAHDYPKCQVIGIDVVPPSEKEGWNLSAKINHEFGKSNNNNNVKFQYGDLLQPDLMFPDNHFDLVYQRDVATVLPFKSWPNLIDEFFRITKSGGQIELVEYDLLFSNPGPVLTQVNEWYRSAAATIGVNPDYTAYLSEFLKEAGFVDVEVKLVDIAIGEWPEGELKKQHGYLYKEQMRALFKSMKRWWCSEIKVTQEEYDRVCAEALDEFEAYQSSAQWKIFTARKP
ncbi:S-adenosyl-L-methionine-dependent methyltransferase [Gilbertella persicaria]|uniref:S-adenosyl-L-methionine-dependent methyltransferase n=1 Tax=Gilbertella persicaria TaxID=101096 RepID=UPI00221F33CB|nr:S-adenosyl-L-methionine-dependent methyltransferase [Gilbertella persicaria]KAI8098427.1 S-adenosyl-L-methionine-dependent methyltransferase [Gilbertella persicaria]